MPESSAINHLNNLGIQYRLIKHPPDVRTAIEFAEKTGIPVDRVFKTLLLKARKSFLLCSIPTNFQVDMKKLSDISHLIKISMASKAEISEITGYELFTVSPFGQHQLVPYFVDISILEGNFVYLGAGTHGYDIEIDVNVFIQCLDPTLADIVKRE